MPSWRCCPISGDWQLHDCRSVLYTARQHIMLWNSNYVAIAPALTQELIYSGSISGSVVFFVLVCLIKGQLSRKYDCLEKNDMCTYNKRRAVAAQTSRSRCEVLSIQ